MSASDSSLTAVYEAIEKTLNEFLLGYEKATAHNDTSYLSTTLTPDCKRRFLPESFLKSQGAPGDFATDNKTYEEMFSKHLPVHATHKTEIKNVTIDAWKKKAAATTVFHCKYSDGEPLLMEFGWFLSFTDDGTKVNEVWEVIDSMEAPKFEEKSKRLLEELEAKK
ncbi:hypothetical protein CkaCkLH20_06194 [Colletotrichum karsti]|uniref:SnoaL-like domain-containing protein n=1 Tax=Colletotrichum karsti TaxID=1095194 RepID=A0A9P6I707_9PEZI|nr:uncharacterized protein CkaCkLH20_06194 [Colletotrichum karsti]KAF9876251.1 hypothetical protein CkaCkLH20_06194 [Colletotrichum karsti]